MNNNLQDIKWSENVILVDADYVDKVAFRLIVNFERMLGRRIPQADIARWIDCVALDGGIREGEQETQVVLLHSAKKQQMENFMPDSFEELSSKAFKDHLGEFLINAYPVEDIVGREQQFCDMLQLLSSQKDVKRIILIPDAEQESIYNKVRATLRQADDDKRITLLAMQSMQDWNFRQEILGYSLLAALGISSEEIKSKM
jgi:hypothetical protein